MQIKRGYAEGGFLDDGASIDAVSGNDVPTGSLQAEVRDDIPAQLSEGEFVLPADVVRFIGLDKLMKMRNTAKQGLSDMEAEGQIGGQGDSAGPQDETAAIDAMIDNMDNDVNFEGEMQNFAEGGAVRTRRALPTYEDFTGRKFETPDLTKYITYINAEGDKIQIGFIKGQPVQPIPEGYFPYEADEKPPEEEVPEEGEGTEGEGTAEGTVLQKNDPKNPWYGITASNDSDAIKQHHQIRSDKVTRDRMKDLMMMQEDGVFTDEDIRGALSPDAIRILETRGADKDSWEWRLLKDKSPSELAIWAQKTADTKRRSTGRPDPGYDGKSVGHTGKIGEYVTERFSSIMDDITSKDWGAAALKVIAGVVIGPTALGLLRIGMGKEDFNELFSTREDQIAATDEEATTKNAVAAPTAEEDPTVEAITGVATEGTLGKTGGSTTGVDTYANSSEASSLELKAALEAQQDLNARLASAEARGDASAVDLRKQAKAADENVTRLQGLITTAETATTTAQAGWNTETQNLLATEKDWSGKLDQSNAIQKAIQEANAKELAEQNEAWSGKLDQSEAIQKATQEANAKELAEQNEAWSGKLEQSEAIQAATIKDNVKVLKDQKDAAETEYKLITKELEGAVGKTDAISLLLTAAQEEAAATIKGLSTEIYDAGIELDKQMGLWDADSEVWVGKLEASEITRGKESEKYALELATQVEEAQGKYDEISLALEGSEGKTDAISVALKAAQEQAALDIKDLTGQVEAAELATFTQKGLHDTAIGESEAALLTQKNEAKVQYDKISLALEGSEGKTDAISLALKAAQEQAVLDIDALELKITEAGTAYTAQTDLWDASELEWEGKEDKSNTRYDNLVASSGKELDASVTDWSGKVAQSDAIGAAVQTELDNTKLELKASQEQLANTNAALTRKEQELEVAINSLPDTPPPGQGTGPLPDTPPPGTGSTSGNTSGGGTTGGTTGGNAVYNQAYWQGQLESGVSQADMAAEQNAIVANDVAAGGTGVNVTHGGGKVEPAVYAAGAGNGTSKYFNAKGGLIGKADKPKVKKMRSDNTTGLAAKKKSKAKAQAKKGALAAKRT